MVVRPIFFLYISLQNELPHSLTTYCILLPILNIHHPCRIGFFQRSTFTSLFAGLQSFHFTSLHYMVIHFIGSCNTQKWPMSAVTNIPPFYATQHGWLFSVSLEKPTHTGALIIQLHNFIVPSGQELREIALRYSKKKSRDVKKNAEMALNVELSGGWGAGGCLLLFVGSGGR